MFDYTQAHYYANVRREKTTKPKIVLESKELLLVVNIMYYHPSIECQKNLEKKDKIVPSGVTRPAI